MTSAPGLARGSLPIERGTIKYPLCSMLLTTALTPPLMSWGQHISSLAPHARSSQGAWVRGNRPPSRSEVMARVFFHSLGVENVCCCFAFLPERDRIKHLGDQVTFCDAHLGAR